MRYSHFGRVEKIAMKMKFEGIVANWRIAYENSLIGRGKNDLTVMMEASAQTPYWRRNNSISAP